MGLVITLCLPALQIVRESMRRAACGNKLRQIGLATMNFYEANGHFPLAKQATRRRLAPSQFSVLPDHLIGVGSASDGFPPRLEGGGSWLLGSGAVVFLDYSAGTTVLPDMASIHGPASGGQVSATAAP